MKLVDQRGANASVLIFQCFPSHLLMPIHSQRDILTFVRSVRSMRKKDGKADAISASEMHHEIRLIVAISLSVIMTLGLNCLVKFQSRSFAEVPYRCFWISLLFVGKLTAVTSEIKFTKLGEFLTLISSVLRPSFVLFEGLEQKEGHFL